MIRDELFTNEGRTWCPQCEQLVDRATGAACTSSFCKVKA